MWAPISSKIKENYLLADTLTSVQCKLFRRHVSSKQLAKNAKAGTVLLFPKALLTQLAL